MKYLKDDIDFLEQILEKVESRNMHDQLEGYGMLRDQISNMQKRHLTPAALDSEGRAVLEGEAYKILYFDNDTITLTRCQ
jgi:hypothetical protein